MSDRQQTDADLHNEIVAFILDYYDRHPEWVDHPGSSEWAIADAYGQVPADIMLRVFADVEDRLKDEVDFAAASMRRNYV